MEIKQNKGDKRHVSIKYTSGMQMSYEKWINDDINKEKLNKNKTKKKESKIE